MHLGTYRERPAVLPASGDEMSQTRKTEIDLFRFRVTSDLDASSSKGLSCASRGGLAAEKA